MPHDFDHNHHFTGTQQAEYDSLHHKGRSYYDDLRWHHFASHETAFDAAMKTYGGKSPELLALEARLAEIDKLPRCAAISPEGTKCTDLASHNDIDDEHIDETGLIWSGPEPDHFDTSIPGEYCDVPKGNGVFVRRCACGQEFYERWESVVQTILNEHIKDSNG